jgi:hypothetical protein
MLFSPAGLGAGAEVSVSPVMGKGFPVDQIPADAHPTVLLFATGGSHGLSWTAWLLQLYCRAPVVGDFSTIEAFRAVQVP